MQSTRDTADDFKDKRMANAYYWAAQTAGWMRNGPNAGLAGTYYVEIIGGKPVLVMDESWTESKVQAVKDGLRDANFPAPLRVRKLDGGDEWRLFISEPSDGRFPSSYYEGDWRAFDIQGGFSATRFEEDTDTHSESRPSAAGDSGEIAGETAVNSKFSKRQRTD